jgi:hypothetical protein
MVTQAIEMNVAEVELGKIATQKAQNSRVKEFAAMMVKDHSASLEKLRPLQGGISATSPNSKHQETAERLSKLSGAEFDREYMNVMVKAHQEALSFYEKLAAPVNAGSAPPAPPAATQEKTGAAVPAPDSTGQELAKLAEGFLPTTRRHSQTAQKINMELQGTSKPTGQNPKAPSRETHSETNHP